jgi:hypothetical protein
VFAHAVALYQLALEAMALQYAGLAFVLLHIVFVALHRHRIELHGVEVGPLKHGLLRTFCVEDPKIAMNMQGMMMNPAAAAAAAV